MTNKEFHQYFMNTMAQTFVVDGEEYNLLDLGWTPGYCNTRKAIGRCRYSKSGKTKRIEISKHYLAIEGQNNATMRDTVLHEIAHAIDVEIRGKSDHSHHWKRVARQVGADPTRTTDQIVQPTGKYTLRCPTCEKTKQMYRQPSTKKSCSSCSGGRYNPDHMMEVWDNTTGREVGYAEKRRRREAEFWARF